MNNYKKILVLLVLTACLMSFSSFNILGQAYANKVSDNSSVNKTESGATFSHSTAPEVSEILVKYKGGKNPGPSADSDFSKEGPSLEKVKIEEHTDLNSLMDKYRNNPGVESVQPNYVYKSLSVNDPYRSKQWGLDVIQADSAWTANTSMGEGVTVAIVDTGIDLDHEDLAANIIGGYNAINGGSYNDDNGHGTHVAGIVAAIPNNGKGISGVAGRAKLLAVKVLDKTGKGTTDSVVKGIRWAADHGANIINLSLGNYENDAILEQAINYAYDKGCFIVAASGNDGIGDVSYPAAYRKVLSVGAVNESNQLADLSNFGPKVEVVAPGVNITSTLPNHLAVDGFRNYGQGSGTSMAAPYVSGIAALIKSKNPSYTPYQVYEDITKSVTDAGILGSDSTYGFGIINAGRALTGASAGIAKLKTGDSLEDNNGFNNATKITGTAQIAASMYPKYDSDWYKIIVPKETKAYVLLKPQSSLDIAMNIYENQQVLTPGYYAVDNGLSGKVEDYTLWPTDHEAAYYIKVVDINSGNALKNYELSVTYSPMSSSSKNTGVYVVPQRISGSDRYSTAALTAKEMFGTSQYAVLATGEDYPDALSAAPLAKKYNAPILLTSSKVLEEPTSNALKSLGVKNVFIIGGFGAVSKNVESKLTSIGIQCTRIYGSSRYETCLAIANYLGPVEGAFIASGESFADALSVSSLAASLNYPILLTEKSNLPSGIINYLQSKGISKSYVIGGTGVISDSVLNKIPNSQRIYGSDRYDTNIKVLEAFKDIINLERVYLATGENYPDALAGSVFASNTGSPLILVSPYADRMTEEYIRGNAAKIYMCYIFGGEGAVSHDVFLIMFGYYE